MKRKVDTTTARRTKARKMPARVPIRSSRRLVTRWYTPLTVSGNSGSDQISRTYFTLSNLWNGATDLTGPYGEFRIVKVMYRFRLFADQSNGTIAQFGTTKSLVNIVHASDSRGILLGSAAAVSELENAKWTTLSDASPVSRWFSFKPYAADAVYQGAFSGYGRYGGFVSTQYPNTEWYGLCHAMLGQSGQTTVGVYSVDCKLVIEVRNQA